MPIRTNSVGREDAMSRLPWAMAVVLLTASGARAASDQLPTLKTGTPYSQARASLLHSGHRPIPSDQPVDRCSVGRENVCRTYPEADSCAGMGHGLCSFEWRTPGGQKFLVNTTGETPTVANLQREGR
jgi:hypothetical protein